MTDRAAVSPTPTRLFAPFAVFAIFAIFALTALVTPVPALAASSGSSEPAEPRDEGNVRVTITIGETREDGSTSTRPYDLVVRLGSGTDMSTGWRVPIPTTRFNAANASDGGLVPMTSYTYQTIGLMAAVRARSLGSGRVVLSGKLEISTFDAPKGTAQADRSQPTIGTITQNFEVSAARGETIRIATGPKPDGGLYHIDVGLHSAD